MFVGSIPHKLAGYIAEGLKPLGKLVVVGCSGGFTIERALTNTPLKAVSNDISLFTSALGMAIVGDERVIAKPKLGELEPHCTTPRDLAITLLVLSGNYSKQDIVMMAMRRQVMFERFGDLHAQTKAKLEPTLAALSRTVCAFTLDDVAIHFASYPGDVVRACYMPTYLGGYEKMWAPVEALFDWVPPEAPPLTVERKRDIFEGMMGEGHYVWVDDNPELGDALDARPAALYARPNKRTIHVYSDCLPSWAYTERPTHRESMVRFASRFDASHIGLSLLTAQQANYVRETLTHNMIGHIARAHMGGTVNFGVVTPSGLVGAFGLGQEQYSGVGSHEAYMLYDLAVPGLHRRLSKLVVMLALGREATRAAATRLNIGSIDAVQTTAFTDRPVSMKYRGIMKLRERREGFLTYVGEPTGRTIEETVTLWKNKYGK